MHEETALITTIAIGLALAFVGGLIAKRLGTPPIVGYLLAGVAVGPFTPGFVADPGWPQLAEIGVILLMFGVGLHFSLRRPLAVRRIAIPGAVGQIVVATVLGTLVGSRSGLAVRRGARAGPRDLGGQHGRAHRALEEPASCSAGAHRGGLAHRRGHLHGLVLVLLPSCTGR